MFFFLNLIVFLFASLLFGAEQQDRICQLAFDTASTGVLYAEDGTPARPKTTFSIECSADGVVFRFDAEKADEVDGELEVFVQPSLDLPNGNYYQFYTQFSNLDASFTDDERILLAQRGVPGTFHPSLRIHYYYFTERMPGFPYLKDYRTQLARHATGCMAEILIPWNALAHILPFDDNGKGNQWRFSAFRRADGVSSAWQGRLHKAPTWGRLVFPDISLDQLAEIYRTIAVQNTMKTEPVIDRTLFDSASIPNALAAQEKERAVLEKKIPSASVEYSLAEMRQLSAATDRMRTYREVLTAFHANTRIEWKGWALESVSIAEDGSERVTPLVYIPEHGYVACGADGQPDSSVCRDGRIPAIDTKTEVGKALRLRYVFPEAVSDQARLTDLCAVVHGAAPRKLRCTITLNGDALVTDHDPAEAPVHVDLPDIEKGDELVISLREADGLPVIFSFFSRVETERFGLLPRAPINHDRLRPLDRTLPVKKDNEYDMHFAAVYAEEISRLLQEKPRVIQFGGWFEIGFRLYAKPLQKALYEKYRLTHIGNISDDNIITNLKLENYLLDTLQPSMIILNAVNVNNVFSSDPEDVRAALRESIRIIREKVPAARIVILGVVPRPKSAERSKCLNLVVAKFAAEENIPYRDLSPVFLDSEGRVREDLFMPGYMTPEGYRLWMELLVPDLESTLQE